MSKIAGDQSIATESVGKVPTDVDGKEKYSSPTEMLQEPGNEFGLVTATRWTAGLFQFWKPKAHGADWATIMIAAQVG